MLQMQFIMRKRSERPERKKIQEMWFPFTNLSKVEFRIHPKTTNKQKLLQSRPEFQLELLNGFSISLSEFVFQRSRWL